MAEEMRKRQRAEITQTLVEEEEDTTTTIKRHKSSFNHIISLLTDEEDDQEKFAPEPKSTSDLSSFMTSLQQELSDFTAASAAPASDEDDKERVFRHLLEASDDELGLPTKTEESFESVAAADESLIMEGLNDFWEIEDEAANYYAMLQCDIFM